jgi:DNA (cytosine-5)-methyltransferase 1
MRLLDLFCGAGGDGMGYHRAGFEVVGVDIKPQPHYPFEFHQADALEYVREHGREFDAIHASPPCQAYSMMTRDHSKHPDLYGPTRSALIETGLPWIIENVIAAPYHSGVTLCGTMFGLGIWRHRNFETSWLILMPMVCDHSGERPVTISQSNGTPEAKGIVDYKHARQAPFSVGRRLMGMPWAETQSEIGLAIPTAYTEWIGRQLIAALPSTV